MTALNHNTINTTTNTTSTELYYANPYDTSAQGFYFTSWTDYCEKVNAHGCEEFEIDYIDGALAELWATCGVDQSNLDLWLDLVWQLQDHELTALYYLCDSMGYGLAEALDVVDDYPVTQGTAKEYAEEYIESTGMLDALPEQLRYYFDVDAFARDLVLNGDIYEFTYDGDSYTASR